MSNEKELDEVAIFKEMQKSPLLFVKMMWGLSPQAIKPEYYEKWRQIEKLTFTEFENARDLITVDWFEPFVKYKNITWQQFLVLFSIEKAIKNEASRKISIASGHGVGKSSSMSWVILWYLFCFFEAQCPCTAPTADQIYDVLWKELKLWIEKMPEGIKEKYEWQTGYIRMSESPETWFARAKTASKENSEALAGVHADHVLTIADEACHDDKTEILTESGWVLFSELEKDVKVMTLNPTTGKGEYQYPSKYHEYDHDGDMVVASSRGLNFSITPNHDLWVKTKKASYRKVKADSLTGGDMYIPRTIDFTGDDSASEDIVRLYAWFISEGSLVRNTNKTINGITIAQSEKNEDHRREITQVAKNLGFKPRVYKKDIVIGNTQFAKKLAEECGVRFKNKRIPSWIKQLSPRLLNVFLDTFVKGDGYTRDNRDILYTSSPQLASDLQEMVLKTGCNSVMSVRAIKGQRKWIVDHWGVSSCDGFVISRTKNNSHAKINKSKTKKEYYKGKVYCVTVPNGLVMTRRNGYAMWSGNSGVPEQIFNTAEGAWTSGDILVILISNPTRTEGYFYDTHHKLKDKWQTLQFSSIDSPIVDKEYEANIAERHGRDSTEYGIRVLGQFPDAGTMDDAGYISLLTDKAIYEQPRRGGIFFSSNAVLGVDPAGEGDDKTSWVIRDNFKAYKVHEELKSTSKTIAEKTITLITEYNLNPYNVIIDSFGVGADVGKEIAIATRGRMNVQTVNVGDPSDSETDKELYLNKRAEYYYKLKLWVQGGGEFIEDRNLKEEVLSIKYKRNLRGKIQIMPKVEMKKRYGARSPNDADALMLTFAIDIPKQNQKDVYDAQRMIDEYDFDEFDVLPG